jgi:hypothetical protein
MGKKALFLKYYKYDAIDLFWRDFIKLPCNPYVIGTDFGKFKCLLVHLTKTGDYSMSDYPIALGTMASLLRMNKGSVKILIQDAGQYNPDDYAGYNLICFYPMSVLLKNLLDLTVRVKSDHPEAKICLFNSDQHQHEMILCSPRAEDIGRSLMEEYPSIDFILAGEAEMSFLMLCRTLAGENHIFREIPSCLYRETGRIMLSEKKVEPVDFCYLPFPSRDFLEESISPEGVNRHSPRIQSSRGCVSRCSYCVESSANITQGGRKNPWLGRDIIRFVDEIEILSNHYGVVFFNIIDSSFEDPGKRGLSRIRTFCEEIISRKISASFKAHFRMETLGTLDDDFLGLLKEAGADILIVGAESGLDNELRSYKKITTAGKNIDTIRRMNDYGKFFVLLGHMMFSPCLELSDLPRKAGFLRDIHNGWDYLNMSNNLLVFRGTAYHDFILDASLVLKTDNPSAVVPYRYLDERVKLVADEMGSLRTQCPEVILLHNKLYDALNIKARYHNKMNRHLWERKDLFGRFTGSLGELLLQVEEVYCGYFLELVELARMGSEADELNTAYEKWIPGSIPGFLDKAGELSSGYISGLEDAGLSTERLYLRTWMSLINTETNTSKGELISA